MRGSVRVLWRAPDRHFGDACLDSVALAPQSSNDQDVAPPGSWACNAVALVGVTR
jgi:hypothetical protein